jgi:hypothetical protein
VYISAQVCNVFVQTMSSVRVIFKPTFLTLVILLNGWALSFEMKVSRDVNLLISNPIVCEGNAYTTTTKSKGAEKLNDNLTIDNDSIALCISI